MGYVLEPRHDPRLSYEDNLAALDRHYRRHVLWRLWALLGAVAAGIIIPVVAFLSGLV